LRRRPVADLASATIPQLASLFGAGIGGAALILGWVALTLREPTGVRPPLRQVLMRAAFGFVALGFLLWFITYLESGGGVPLIFALVLAVTAFVWIVLTRSALGRHFYAVGGNVEASRASGIAVERVKWIGFAMAGA